MSAPAEGAPGPAPLAGARICMLLCNPFTHDSRVLKEGRTLLEAGAEVRIVAREGHGLPARETVDGLRVTRVAYDPLPTRAVRALVARRRGPAAAAGEPVTMPPRPAPAAGPRRALHELELGVRRLLVGAMYLRWSRLAVREARREPLDLVVAHDFETLPAAAALARLTRRPYLYDSHELAADQGQIVARTRVGLRRLQWVERRLAQRAAAVVTINDSLADEIARRCRIPRPAVVRNVPYAAVPLPAAAGWRHELGLPPDARVAAYVGGLVEHRGLEDLIPAVAGLPDVVLVMMGPAERRYRERLAALARDAGVQERVHLLAPVPSAEVAARVAAADVGVIPFRRSTLNHWYSLPNKLFEYLAAGVPVVSVAFPELRRIVERYEVGRVCAPEDVPGLAAAIAAVLDPQENARLRANARRAAAELTWEREAPAYLDAVGRALARSR